MNILIVDDSAFMREVLKDIVKTEREDAAISEAENGVEALKACTQAMPDLVLLDLIMPEKGGIDVLKEIGKKTSVIVISATGQQDLMDQAKTLGAREFILKPFEEEQVRLAIQNSISQS